MPVTIENPILNSPFTVPDRHWRTVEDGITDDPVEGRRSSAYLIPVPPPREKGAQPRAGRRLPSVTVARGRHAGHLPWSMAMTCGELGQEDTRLSSVQGWLYPALYRVAFKRR